MSTTTADAATEAWTKPHAADWKPLFRAYLDRSEAARCQLHHLHRVVRPVHTASRLAVVDASLAIDTTAGALAARAYLPLAALLQQPPVDAGSTLPADARGEMETVQQALADPHARLYLVSGAVTRAETGALPADGHALALASTLPYLARPADRVPAGAAPLRDPAHPARTAEAQRAAEVPLCAPLLVQEGETALAPEQIAPFARMGEHNLSALFALGGTDKRALAHGAMLLPRDPVATGPPASLADAAWVLVPSNHILRTMCEMGVRDPETRELLPDSQAAAVLLPLDGGRADEAASSVLPVAILPARVVATVLRFADVFLRALLPDALPREAAGFSLALVDRALAPVPWTAVPAAAPVQLRATLRLALMVVPAASHEHLYPSTALRDPAAVLQQQQTRAAPGGEKEE